MNDSKLDNIMRKLNLLMERADHPKTPPEEADACRMKADTLMLKYKIESITGGGGNANSVIPVWKKMTVGYLNSEFRSYYASIASEVIAHVGGRGMLEVDWSDEGGSLRYLEAVAFESDLRYAEVLLVSCILEFGKRLEPKYDHSLSDRENVYNMRSAGMERGRIANVMFGRKETLNEQKAQNRKVTKLFKEACAEKGEDSGVLLGRGNNMASFREAYAHGFVQTIRLRLQRMRSNRGAEASGLVLMDLSERVNEAFYERYPNMRPRKSEPWVDPRQTCEKCRKAASGYCREHAYLKPGKPQYKTVRGDGYYRGADAANMVDLGREGTPKANAASARGEIG